jgi:glycosyltransferase involved in cell wall biosynthesis
MKSICIYPPQTGQGGPASFAGRLSAAMERRGVEVQADPLAPDCAVILIIGGSKRLDLIWRARRNGVRVVQRLNGMNWLHRKLNTGLRHSLRSEVNNGLLATIRSRLADAIIYQSQFSREWWQRVYGPIKARENVVLNGVDLQAFSPAGPQKRPDDHFRLLMVEGRLAGGYAAGLDNAVELLEELERNSDQRWELVVAGDAPSAERTRLDRTHPELWITWAGMVPRQQVPELDRTAHVLFSADLNAACPNSVIEALACGLPVAAYATGALAELVTDNAGCVVPYGSNFWKLEPPVVAPLAAAIQKIAHEQEKFRQGARALAEEKFDINAIVDQYLAVLAV